jgi:hypothetical protein
MAETAALPNPLPLAYLFEAQFSDGSIITQTQDDSSTLKPGGSAFTDVLEKAKTSDPVAFGLFSDEHPHTYAVNLETGEFEIDGVPFRVGDEVPPEGAKLRLIYFRNIKRSFRAIDFEPIEHKITFVFGWQTTTADGRNIKQTIAVE